MTKAQPSTSGRRARTPRFGWRYAPNGQLEPHPDERRAIEIVMRMRRKRVRHGCTVWDHSLREVAEELDRRGLRSRRGRPHVRSRIRAIEIAHEGRPPFDRAPYVYADSEAD